MNMLMETTNGTLTFPNEGITSFKEHDEKYDKGMEMDM